MVGKVSDRVLLREGWCPNNRIPVCRNGSLTSRSPGLERTDNGMKQSNWPDVPPINQKNYYT